MTMQAIASNMSLLCAASLTPFESNVIGLVSEYGFGLPLQDAPLHEQISNAARVLDNPKPLLAKVFQTSDSIMTSLEGARYFGDRVTTLHPEFIPTLLILVTEDHMQNWAPLAENYRGGREPAARIAQYFDRLADIMRFGLWRVMVQEDRIPLSKINAYELRRLQSVSAQHPDRVLPLLDMSEIPNALKLERVR